MDALYYGHVCSAHPVNEDTEPTPAMRKEAERIAKGIFDGTITSGEIDPALTTLVAEDLRNAIVEGFGKDLPAIDYETPDYDKLANLEKNVYQFSAAKDFQQLKSMTLTLKDGDKIRTFTEFRNEALKISDVYNGPWLRTEYNTAVGSAQMAAKWNRFYKDKNVLPLLQYRTVEDDRVRPSHAALDLVIKNIDDPFWDMYYPPNGWNCRCDVIQVVHGTETPDKDIVTPDDVPKMFQTNMAKEGMVFPKNSPYYIDLPDAIKKQAEDLLGKRILNWASKNLKGKKVIAPEIGEVEITKPGLKEMIRQGHEFKVEKNQAIYALENILKNAQYIKSAPDSKGRFKQFHYFKFKLKGKDSYINVAESFNGQKIVYTIVDKLKMR